MAVASEYSAAPDGLKAWKQVIDRGYEGYVAKDGASVYEGGPTRRWLKVKQKGWTPMAAAHQHWRESLPSSRSGARAAV